jgi:hypothetical protein
MDDFKAWYTKVEGGRRIKAGETILPEFGLGTFHCQRCFVYAPQQWQRLTSDDPIWRCTCVNCAFTSYWHALKSEPEKARLVFPGRSGAPVPHAEMPDDVRDDYQEAGEIVDSSPRGAGALLRLALQKLMPHLGGTGKNINDDIASLVQKGLSPSVQQALDSLRVIGNHAVHPGELDLQDDPETVHALFDLLNFIVEDRIARPKKLDELYGKLPERARVAIEERDAPKGLTRTPPGDA